jgi:plastocyanin
LIRRSSTLFVGLSLVGSLVMVTARVVAAAPATPSFTIAADRPAAVPAGHKWAFNDFFPRSATIETGGTFQFVNQGFHTATLLPPSWTPAADLDVNGLAAADTDDTTLNPNGTTKSLERIEAVLPVPVQGCGTPDSPCTFDGTGIVSMGAPLTGPPAPFVVTVTAPPGTYVFHCRVHPGMSGTLNVVAKGAQGVTTDESANAAATAQATADVAAGMAAEAAASKAAQKKNANGTSTWTLSVGTGDPSGHVAVLDMLPRSLKIKKGDTVVWRPLSRNEPHTVTFPTDINTDAIPMCEGPGGKDTPAVPTVVPPQSPFDFACSGHPADEIEFGGGNGVRSITSPTTVSDSGLIAYRTEAAAFDAPATIALSRWSVSFAGAAKGTYHYVCQIHDGMEGTIVVQ